MKQFRQRLVTIFRLKHLRNCLNKMDKDIIVRDVHKYNIIIYGNFDKMQNSIYRYSKMYRCGCCRYLTFVNKSTLIEFLFHYTNVIASTYKLTTAKTN